MISDVGLLKNVMVKDKKEATARRDEAGAGEDEGRRRVVREEGGGRN
jgi:hypothetical protein